VGKGFHLDQHETVSAWLFYVEAIVRL